MKNWLMNLMAGRNGADQFCRFLSYASLFFLALSLFASGSPVASAALVLALAGLVYSWFRALSKNIYRRSQENAAYLRIKDRALGRFGSLIARLKQRKDYSFFRCPSCKALLRVPRGKGRLNITCRKCGERFTKKT